MGSPGRPASSGARRSLIAPGGPLASPSGGGPGSGACSPSAASGVLGGSPLRGAGRRGGGGGGGGEEAARLGALLEDALAEVERCAAPRCAALCRAAPCCAAPRCTLPFAAPLYPAPGAPSRAWLHLLFLVAPPLPCTRLGQAVLGWRGVARKTLKLKPFFGGCLPSEPSHAQLRSPPPPAPPPPPLHSLGPTGVHPAQAHCRPGRVPRHAGGAAGGPNLPSFWGFFHLPRLARNPAQLPHAQFRPAPPSLPPHPDFFLSSPLKPRPPFTPLNPAPPRLLLAVMIPDLDFNVH